MEIIVRFRESWEWLSGKQVKFHEEKQIVCWEKKQTVNYCMMTWLENGMKRREAEREREREICECFKNPIRELAWYHISYKHLFFSIFRGVV